MKKISILPTIITLVLCLASATMQAATWEYEWDAINTLPGDAGWTVVGDNSSGGQGPQGYTISANVFINQSWAADADTGWTVAFRVKRDDSNAGFASLSFIGDDQYGNDFNYFASDRYRISTDSGLIYPTAPDSSNMIFQDVQIARSGNIVNVYMNGDDTPFASYEYTAAAGGNANIVRFGDFTSGDPVSTIQYVKYTTEGAFTPSQIPEPSNYATMLSLFAVCLFGYQLRKRQ